MRKVIKLGNILKTRHGVKKVMEPMIRGKGGLSLTKRCMFVVINGCGSFKMNVSVRDKRMKGEGFQGLQ